jgi:AcrR family transcriptional regulator
VTSVSSRSSKRDEFRAQMLRAAQERYLRGERIEIATLAAEHGVSRASAYRWLGDNDQLLCDVLMERTRRNFEDRRSENYDKHGREYVLAVLDGFLRHAAESEHLHALLRAEPQRVLRIVASPAFPIQRRVVGLIQALLVEAEATGDLTLAVDPHTTAYAIVRLLEGFLYADVVAGEDVRIDQASALFELLVPPATAPRTHGRARGASRTQR